MRFGPCLLVLSLVAPGDGLPATETERGVPRFTDRTRVAGIDFQHYNGARGGYHLLEIMGSGAALLDFDGDGYLDLFVVAGSQIPPSDTEESRSRLFRNRRDGTFRDATLDSGLQIRTYGMGAAAGDYDNDGDPDLYVTGYPRSQLFQNQGDGRFRDVSREAGVENSGHWGSSAGFFDYDRDGLLDLFVCNYVAYDPGKETPCHTAGRRNYCHPTTFETDASALYRNLGNGRFQDRSETSGIGGHRARPWASPSPIWSRTAIRTSSLLTTPSPTSSSGTTGTAPFRRRASTRGWLWTRTDIPGPAWESTSATTTATGKWISW